MGYNYLYQNRLAVTKIKKDQIKENIPKDLDMKSNMEKTEITVEIKVVEEIIKNMMIEDLMIIESNMMIKKIMIEIIKKEIIEIKEIIMILKKSIEK